MVVVVSARVERVAGIMVESTLSVIDDVIEAVTDFVVNGFV